MTSVWTYFIRRGEHSKDGPIKIGRTICIDTRVKKLQHYCAEKLEVMLRLRGDHEKKLHERFAAYRLEREWFSPANEILDYIESVSSSCVYKDDQQHRCVRTDEILFAANGRELLPSERKELSELGLSGQPGLSSARSRASRILQLIRIAGSPEDRRLARIEADESRRILETHGPSLRSEIARLEMLMDGLTEMENAPKGQKLQRKLF
jgi:hypothetical protein